MDKRTHILEESFKLFAKYGYGLTTMQQIGDAVGLDKSSLYAHFESKQEIYIENFELEHKSYIENVVNQLPDIQNVGSLFQNLLQKTLEYYDKERIMFWKHAYVQYCSGVESKVNEHIAHGFLDIARRIETKVDALLDRESRQEKQKIILALFILIQGVLDWHMRIDDLDTDTILTSLGVCESMISSSSLFGNL